MRKGLAANSVAFSIQEGADLIQGWLGSDSSRNLNTLRRSFRILSPVGEGKAKLPSINKRGVKSPVYLVLRD